MPASRSALLTRILAILLLAIVLEFVASTLFYERIARVQLQEEEAHRVAEHLAVGYRLLESRPPAERPALAERVSSAGFRLQWRATPAAPPPIAPQLRQMRDQILQWEPDLKGSNLHLYFAPDGRTGTIRGAALLSDGGALVFEIRPSTAPPGMALSRFLLALIPAMALIVIAGLLLRRTLRPLGELTRAAQAVGEGRELFVEEQGPGEVRRVIRAFNAMQSRIHRLIADRTQALAAAGHDLRTPLSRLRLRSEAVSDPALRSAMADDLQEMEDMVESLLAFFGGDNDPGPVAKSDVAVLVQTLVDELHDLGADVLYTGPDHAEMQARPVRLKRALRNLVDNALHYGGAARVSLRITKREATIAVEDDGPGIPDAQMADALRPFVRLDQARTRNTNGLGLGLSIVERIVRGESGTLHLANRPEGGLRAEIRLPIGSAETFPYREAALQQN